jgi:hypothetical protein
VFIDKGAGFALRKVLKFDGPDSASHNFEAKEREAMAGTRQLRRAMGRTSEIVVTKARALVESHEQFAGRGRLIEFQYQGDVLVVRGKLPTFYLKQILQSVLRDLDGVRRIDNQVTVDWNDGVIGPIRG